MQRGNVRLLAAFMLMILLNGCNSKSVKDIDGNLYKTVKLGSQVWMAENLKTTKLNDGTKIAMISDNDTWANSTTPAYSWYNNDSVDYKKTYGALYNWYAVNTNKLCPTGWHVPSDEEWLTMFRYLKDPKSTGGKMKEAGTAHWKKPNEGATNESGFTALPGGYRSYAGVSNYIGIYAYWWTTTEYNSSTVLFYNIRYKFSTVFKYRSEKNCGFSVRCVMDK